MFSGTSCQVQGLLGVIPQNLKNNLYTVDILCHNIPSGKVWDDYLTWFEKKVNAKIIAVDFRNKEKFGWADHTESLWTTKKVYHNKYYRDLYALDKSDNGTLPELYDKRENCCGCTACFSICPKDAILMEPDEEGFLYPVVDASKCIKCHKCESVCSFKQDQRNKDLF